MATARAVSWALWTGRMLVPVVVLAVLPAMTTAFTGRVFSYPQLARAIPDVRLGTAALSGVALTATRGVLLLRARHAPARAAGG